MKSLSRFLTSRAFALPAAGLILLVAIALAASPVESLGAMLARTVSQVASTVAQKTAVGAPVSQTALAAPEAYEQSVIETVRKSMPAVVAIVATRDVPVIGQCTEQNGRTTYYVPCQVSTQSREVGGGSGFFVSSDGLVLTNKHVVDDDDASYTVFTTDGKSYPATVAASDPVEDLAVLRVQSDGFATLSFADAASLSLGQTAIAIGNALGEFNNTVSVGVVSGVNRTVTATRSDRTVARLTGMIQTDTAINSGNSGGPLLNLQGQVLGITTAVAANAQSIGFALPASRALRLVAAARQGSVVTVPYIGVRYADAKEGGIVLTDGNGLKAVQAGSPAEKAGLRAGDRITSIGGTRIGSADDMPGLIASFDIGAQVILTVIRNGTEKSFTVVIGSRS